MENLNPYNPPGIDAESDSIRFGNLQRIRSTASLTTGVAGGILVWASSKTITGQIEPWDAGWRNYALCIAATSAVAAAIGRSSLLCPIAGVYIGQVLFCAIYSAGNGTPATGPIILPITISAAIYGFVPSLVGAIIGTIPETLLRNRTDVLSQ